MLSKFGKIALVLIVGMSILGLYLTYSLSSFSQDSLTQVAQETLRTAAIASRDDSARIEEGIFRLNKDEFEAQFIQLFDEHHVGNTTYVFEFNYLEEDENILAIRVVLLGGNQRHEVTTVLSTANEERK